VHDTVRHGDVRSETGPPDGGQHRLVAGLGNTSQRTQTLMRSLGCQDVEQSGADAMSLPPVLDEQTDIVAPVGVPGQHGDPDQVRTGGHHHAPPVLGLDHVARQA